MVLRSVRGPVLHRQGCAGYSSGLCQCAYTLISYTGIGCPVLTRRTYNFNFSISLSVSLHDPQPHTAVWESASASASVLVRRVTYFRVNARTTRSAKRIDAAMCTHSGSIDMDTFNPGVAAPVIS